MTSAGRIAGAAGSTWTTATWGDQNTDNLARFGDLENYFAMRRLRFHVEGCGYGVYDYRVELDWGAIPEDNNGTSIEDFAAIKDVYIGIHDTPYLGYVRVGHFKAPFSLEELTDGNHTTFIERGLPNVFAPSRQYGIAAYNNTCEGTVHWAGGLFWDDVQEDNDYRALIDDRQGSSVVGRAVYLPYYDEPSCGRYLVHTGASFRYTDDRDDSLRLRARPETYLEETFLETGTLNLDDYTVVGLEAAWVHGQASVQAEWMWANGETMGVDRDFYGAYVLGSYFLTGENRAYKRGTTYAFDRVTPHTNYWLISGCKGMGAWELTARWSWLDLTEGVDTSTSDDASGVMNNYTVGVNWYWNPYARMMFNYIHSDADYNSATNADSEADIWMARMQFDF